MTGPLMLLAVGALCVGWLGLPEYTGLDKFQQYLEPVTQQGHDVWAELSANAAAAAGPEVAVAELQEEGHSLALELGMAGVSLLIALAGIGLATLFYVKRFPALPEATAGKIRPLYALSWNLWYYNRFCMKVIAGGWLKICDVILLFDKYIIDGIVNGCGKVAGRVGREFRQLQTGQTQGYALWVLIGVNMIILICLFFTIGK